MPYRLHRGRELAASCVSSCRLRCIRGDAASRRDNLFLCRCCVACRVTVLAAALESSLSCVASPAMMHERCLWATHCSRQHCVCISVRVWL